MESFVLMFAATLVAFCVLVKYVMAKTTDNTQHQQQQQQQLQDTPQEQHSKKSEDVRRSKPRSGPPVQKKDDKFVHNWLVTSLKGHSRKVTDADFSHNGKYVASSDQDGAVLIWTVKDFHAKEHRNYRANIKFDHANKIRWSPDSKAFLVTKATSKCVEVYKVNKREDGGSGIGSVVPHLVFPNAHETDVIGFGISPTGSYVMSCSEDTHMTIWDLKGDVYDTWETRQMNNTYCAKISPCGRFVAKSGFTPDVTVREIKFNRNKEFEKMHRAFELSGHTSGIYHFDFNRDSSRMATLSKDNSWRLYNTAVDYTLGQDPICLQHCSLTTQVEPGAILALSPDGNVIVVGQRTTLTWFNASTGEILETISEVHTEAFTCVTFDRDGDYLLTTGDKRIRIFHNVPGYKIQMAELKSKLAKTNSDISKATYQKQIEALKSKIDTILKK